MGKHSRGVFHPIYDCALFSFSFPKSVVSLGVPSEVRIVIGKCEM